MNFMLGLAIGGLIGQVAAYFVVRHPKFRSWATGRPRADTERKPIVTALELLREIDIDPPHTAYQATVCRRVEQAIKTLEELE